jgi:hypothetical protein
LFDVKTFAALLTETGLMFLTDGNRLPVRMVSASHLSTSSRLLKNAHLLRFPHPLSLRRMSKYASLFRISGALHLVILEQPAENDFFSKLLVTHPNDKTTRRESAPYPFINPGTQVMIGW